VAKQRQTQTNDSRFEKSSADNSQTVGDLYMLIDHSFIKIIIICININWLIVSV
jgi:hypothetical protein